VPRENQSARGRFDAASTVELKHFSTDTRPALSATGPGAQPEAAPQRISVMTQPTAATARATTAKDTASPSGRPNYAMPKFDLPNMKAPDAFRKLAERRVAQARENYERMQVPANEVNGILDETYSIAIKGVADYNLKLIEIARANRNSAFEFTCGLIAMKLLPEMIELSIEQARKRFKLISEQSNELWTLAEKMANETAEPLKAGVTKRFNNSVGARL
jgi:phasin